MPLDQPNAAAEMPFLDHLEELRWRLVKSIAALAIGFFVAFSVAWQYLNVIITYLTKPIQIGRAHV